MQQLLQLQRVYAAHDRVWQPPAVHAQRHHSHVASEATGGRGPVQAPSHGSALAASSRRPTPPSLRRYLSLPQSAGTTAAHGGKSTVTNTPASQAQPPVSVSKPVVDLLDRVVVVAVCRPLPAGPRPPTLGRCQLLLVPRPLAVPCLPLIAMPLSKMLRVTLGFCVWRRCRLGVAVCDRESLCLAACSLVVPVRACSGLPAAPSRVQQRYEQLSDDREPLPEHGDQPRAAHGLEATAGVDRCGVLPALPALRCTLQ
jgi:hypothetical protein